MLSANNSTVISHTVTNPLQTPVYVNDATVTVTIKDSLGVDLPGEPWPVALPYVAASNGVYTKSFNPFTNLIIGEIYSVIINVTGTDGLKSECISKEKAASRIC